MGFGQDDAGAGRLPGTRACDRARRRRRPVHGEPPRRLVRSTAGARARLPRGGVRLRAAVAGHAGGAGPLPERAEPAAGGRAEPAAAGAGRGHRAGATPRARCAPPTASRWWPRRTLPSTWPPAISRRPSATASSIWSWAIRAPPRKKTSSPRRPAAATRALVRAAVRLVRATRVHPRLRRGASVRGAVAIVELAASVSESGGGSGPRGGDDGGALRRAAQAALTGRVELRDAEAGLRRSAR